MMYKSFAEQTQIGEEEIRNSVCSKHKEPQLGQNTTTVFSSESFYKTVDGVRVKVSQPAADTPLYKIKGLLGNPTETAEELTWWKNTFFGSSPMWRGTEHDTYKAKCNMLCILLQAPAGALVRQSDHCPSNQAMNVNCHFSTEFTDLINGKEMKIFYNEKLRAARDIAFNLLTTQGGPAPGERYLPGIASADDLVFQPTQFSCYNASSPRTSKYRLRSRETPGVEKHSFDFHLDSAVSAETAAAVHASKYPMSKGLKPAEIRHQQEKHNADRRRLAVVFLVDAAEEGGDFMIYRGRNSTEAYLNRGNELKVHLEPGDVLVFDTEHLWHSVSTVKRGRRLSIVQPFEVSDTRSV